MVDDLEATAPSIHQHYSDEVALSVRSALTDAELFISYNMPAKALGPLLAALPLAPKDLRLNQRLAALHTRAGRFAEAAVCCRTLQNLYSDAEHPDEATRYGELAERYEERSSVPAHTAAHEDAPIFLDAPEPDPAPAEFSVDEPAAEQHRNRHRKMQLSKRLRRSRLPGRWLRRIVCRDYSRARRRRRVCRRRGSFGSGGLSGDCGRIGRDRSFVGMGRQPHGGNRVPAEPEPEAEINAVGEHDIAASAKTDETIEEIRFYLANGMPEQAEAALAKLQTLTSDDRRSLSSAPKSMRPCSWPPTRKRAEPDPVLKRLLSKTFRRRNRGRRSPRRRSGSCVEEPEAAVAEVVQRPLLTRGRRGREAHVHRSTPSPSRTRNPLKSRSRPGVSKSLSPISRPRSAILSSRHGRQDQCATVPARYRGSCASSSRRTRSLPLQRSQRRFWENLSPTSKPLWAMTS